MNKINIKVSLTDPIKKEERVQIQIQFKTSNINNG
jgi:hypothetical protein